MDRLLNTRLIIWIIIVVSILFIIYGVIVKINNRSRIQQSIELTYFPKKNMTKIFKNATENASFTHIVDKIANGKIQLKQVDLLTRTVLVYDVTGDSIRLVYTEEVGNDGFEKDYISNLVPNREDTILKSPVEAGTKWMDDDGGQYEIIKTKALVETNAGDFETVVVRYTNKDFTVKEYYAQDIGLVKIVVNNYGEFLLEQITY
jgi:hypothetical protein